MIPEGETWVDPAGAYDQHQAPIKDQAPMRREEQNRIILDCGLFELIDWIHRYIAVAVFLCTDPPNSIKPAWAP